MKNTINPPGQVKPKDHVEDQILNDYLERKYYDDVLNQATQNTPPPKKLTFDEWWHQNNDEHTHYERDRKIWKAAQENK